VSAAGSADAVVMAAAPADFRPVSSTETKIKKNADGSAPSLELIQTPDILAELAHDRVRPGQVVVGFAAETGDDTGSVLELGGNDPLIVMEDADLDEASSLAVQGSYRNSGQRCTAVKRILVHEKVHKRFVDLLTGGGRIYHETHFAPMLRLQATVREIALDGAEILPAAAALADPVPVVVGLAEEVREAQLARGLGMSPRAFAVPLVVRSLRHADALGEALAARGVDD